MTDTSDPRDENSRRVSPVVARRQLLRRFVQARLDAGFSSREQAAEALGWSTRKQIQMESDKQTIPLGDLDGILSTFKVPEAEWPTWRQLAETARTKGWWDAYGDVDLSGDAKRFIGLEWGATRVRAFTGTIVPALLQIPAYTETALRHWVSHRPPEQVKRALEVRRLRQRVLGPPDPLEYHVVIDEAALYRPAGDAATMQAQLLYVVDQAETRPNVTVQVVPFSAGTYPGQSGNFMLLDFDGRDDDPGIVHLEPGFANTLFLDDRANVYLYSQVFQQLVELASAPDESLQRLRTVAISAKGSIND
jgi:hypothetical protein